MILIALGANLPSRYGSSANTIAAAQSKLEELGVKIQRRSRIWLSAPVPASDQPWYHNAVVAVQTELKPDGLMAVLHAVEQDFGRIRTGERNEARLLDLDIIAYKALQMDEEGLVLPHPRLHERAFVLMPLLDIDPDWCHPTLNMSVQEMIESLPADQKAEPLEAAAA